MSFFKAFSVHFLKEKNKLEWVVFFAGFILLAGLLVYLSYQWIRFSETAPRLTFEVKAVPEVFDPGRYQLHVYNEGGQTVKEVQLEAALWRQQKLIEKTCIRLDLLPRHSVRTAWFSFREPLPNNDSIGFHVLSYQ